MRRIGKTGAVGRIRQGAAEQDETDGQAQAAPQHQAPHGQAQLGAEQPLQLAQRQMRRLCQGGRADLARQQRIDLLQRALQAGIGQVLARLGLQRGGDIVQRGGASMGGGRQQGRAAQALRFRIDGQHESRRGHDGVRAQAFDQQVSRRVDDAVELCREGRPGAQHQLVRIMGVAVRGARCAMQDGKVGRQP